MKFNVVLLLSLVIFSCKNEGQKKKDSHKTPAMNVVQQHSESVVLDSTAEKNISSWKFYYNFNKKIELYYAISPSEALSNAIDLADEITRLKNNKKPAALLTGSFKTRIDVLENEILRLKDMATIEAITAEEVNKQVDKVLAAFAATNSKINTVYTKLQVEKEIKIK